MKQAYVALVQDTPGVLNRVVNQFRRRNINIESLSVAPCEKPSVSRITIAVNDVAPERRDFFVQILRNLVNVIEVENISRGSHIVRENVLVKINPPPQGRREVGRIALKNHGRVLRNGGSTVVEASGTTEEMDALISDLGQFNVLELVRSGGVAISRSGESDSTLRTSPEDSSDLSWVTKQLSDYLS